MTGNKTPDAVLRIRIKELPKSGEFDEFDLRRFREGETYDVPAQLASMLIIAGYAELAAPPLRSRFEAADMPSRRTKL